MKLSEDRVKELRAKIGKVSSWEAVQVDDPRGQPVPYYRALVCLVADHPDVRLSVVASDGATITKDRWPAVTELLAAAPDLLDTIEAVTAERDAILRSRSLDGREHNEVPT